MRTGFSESRGGTNFQINDQLEVGTVLITFKKIY